MWHAPVQWARVTEAHDCVIILGSGPSVSQLDMELLRKAQQAGCYVIAINGASDHYPDANAWFTLDPHTLSTRIANVAGKKFVAIPDDFGTPNCRWSNLKDPPPVGVEYLHRLVGTGPLCSKFRLSEDPGAIYTGNSAYGALGLAYLMKAKTIVLLGVDGTFGYFYGEGLPSGNLAHLPELFASALPQLEARGVTVLNGSPHSIVTCFDRMTPNEAIERALAEAPSDQIVAAAPLYDPATAPTSHGTTHFVCVMRTGGVYNARYVNNLFNGVIQNVRAPITFSVITDNPAGLLPAINVIPLKHQWPGWWSKVEMFRPGIWKGGRVWYFDLDTLIVKEMTSMILDPRLGVGMWTLSDPVFPARLASGVMTWMANSPETTEVYTTFVDRADTIMASCSTLGDQCWIGIAIKSRNFLQSLFPNKLVSLKRDCPDGRCLGQAYVVYFHGKPRPHESITKSDTAWVRRYWR